MSSASFTTVNNPGFGSGTGNGLYTQAIDTTQLSEGYHHITTRAYRQRSDGGPDIFTDFKKVVYIDRFKPISAMDSAMRRVSAFTVRLLSPLSTSM